MNRNAIETMMGAMVLAVAVLFVYFAYHMSDVGVKSGYEVKAIFSKVGGLSVGSDVRVSGVKVGTVVDRHLNAKDFNAVVTFTVDNSIQLPTDTIAGIASEGPLGGKYLDLQPGSATTFFQPGNTIKETRAYRSLEDQVGEIIFLATRKPAESEGTETEPRR